MPFDPSTAVPVDQSASSGFDPSTAVPVDQPKAKPQASPPSIPSSSFMPFGQTGALLAPTISKMILGPASQIAGAADIPLHALGITNTEPKDVAAAVQSAEVKPETKGQQLFTDYNPMSLVGEGLGKAGQYLENKVAPPATSGPGRAALGYAAGQLPNLAATLAGGKGISKTAESAPALRAAGEAAKSSNAGIDSVITDAAANGYQIPPRGGIGGALSGLASKVKGEAIDSAHNRENAAVKLGEDVGAPPNTPLTKETIHQLKEETGDVYDQLSKAVGPQVHVTNEFAGKLRKWLSDAEGQTDQTGWTRVTRVLRNFVKKVTPPAEKQPSPLPIFKTIAKQAGEQPQANLANLIERAGGEQPGFHFGERPDITLPPRMTEPPPISTESVMRDMSGLRKAAREDLAHGDTMLYETRMSLSRAMEDMLEENLSRSGNTQALENFRAARQRFAKLYLLDRITDPETGVVDLRKLASLSKTPYYSRALTGQFKIAADFARNFTKATKRATGEAIPRVTPFDLFFGTGAMMLHHPGAAAIELAVRLGIPELIGRNIIGTRVPNYAPNMPARFAGPGAMLGGAMSGIQGPPSGSPP